ncbi:unnamed protein product [Phytophthora lilii]|uniref:Unnamed protein product n=1 Tax=Phytophthora lilii TaxID=2077276 RepID=A0A9W6TZJ8_9STRA|nr:unnamed protein product [Phytophthora lilii]
MSMRDYLQKWRHLVSCIITNPIDEASQVHVFVFGMREGMTRYCLTRAEPKTLEEAFSIALREDYTVSSSYGRALSEEARVSAPEPMEIDAIEASTRGGGPSVVVREGSTDVVVKLADGKSLRVPRRDVSLSYTFDGFTSSDEVLVIEMNYAFVCILGIPWLARYQPEIDWLARSVKRRADFDVSELFTHLLVAPRDWPHVTIVDKTSTTQPMHRASDGPLCTACAVSIGEVKSDRGSLFVNKDQDATVERESLPKLNETGKHVLLPKLNETVEHVLLPKLN